MVEEKPFLLEPLQPVDNHLVRGGSLVLVYMANYLTFFRFYNESKSGTMPSVEGGSLISDVCHEQSGGIYVKWYSCTRYVVVTKMFT